LALNVSGRQLDDRNFAHMVSHTAETHQIPLTLLDLEVTESCLQESDIGIHNLRRLCQLGVSISIDDFGTGYSCMNSLKSLPVTALKIDRTFVKDIHCNPRDRAIANAIIALARELELKTIAEGIENEHQASLLREAGCDSFQGYLYCVPQPADIIQAKLSVTTNGNQAGTTPIAVEQ
jgi:EAL domain-containing protein (putative c-di-GMP-specific phosphodiesterase class I)